MKGVGILIGNLYYTPKGDQSRHDPSIILALKDTILKEREREIRAIVTKIMLKMLHQMLLSINRFY